MKIEKGKRRWIYLLLVGFLFLLVFQDFLHNHPLDYQTHVDCPIYQFVQTVNYSFQLSIAIIAFLLVVLCSCSLPRKIPVPRLLFAKLGSRGPPRI